MVPLIDSIFLILVFFIYAFLSMTVHRGLPVHLPSAMAALIDKADYCAITVSEDNTYFLNKEPVSIDELEGRLRAMIVENPELRVYLNGDKNAHHGAVVAALDRLRAAGIGKISIETNAEETSDE
jgi:biopolymer transport protein ExbD